MNSIRSITVITLAFLFSAAWSLPAAALSNPVADRELVADSNEEIEPAVISQVRFGVEYTVSVYMKFHSDINSYSTLEWSAYTSSGLAGYGAVPALAGYDTYADPVLAQNSSKRIYLTAVAINSSTHETALPIWFSDNGGWTWYGPAAVPVDTGNGGIVDKPALTVGPNDTVYPVWVRHYGSNLMYAQAGTQYGDTWTWAANASPIVSQTCNCQAPQVTVDSDGTIYVLYVDGNNLKTLKSPGSPMNFTGTTQNIPTVPGIGTLYDTGTYLPLRTGVSVRAATIPVAKIDRSTHRLSVAWHEGWDGSHSRIRFAAIIVNQTTPAWTAAPPTIAAAGGHDINVGMDLDTSGNYLVTYYSFGSGSSAYSQVGTYVYFDYSGFPQHETNQMITSRLGDVADYTSETSSDHRFLGEYHDVTFSNGTFKSAHIIVTQTGNPWIITVQH